MITSSSPYPHHEEHAGSVRAVPDHVFGYLDDHTRLSAHMSQGSWRMGWARMGLHMDEAEGRAVGSRLRLDGRVMGIRLWLEEEVTERTPPTRKVWETIGSPRLLVIGPYRMGMRYPDEAYRGSLAGSLAAGTRDGVSSEWLRMLSRPSVSVAPFRAVPCSSVREHRGAPSSQNR